MEGVVTTCTSPVTGSTSSTWPPKLWKVPPGRMKGGREHWKIGATVVGCRGKRLHQSRQYIAGDPRQDRANADARHSVGATNRSLRCRLRGQLDIEAVDKLTKDRIKSIARLRQIDLDLT